MRRISLLSLFVFLLFFGCSTSDEPNNGNGSDDIVNIDDSDDDTPVIYADIDFSNWKVTLPVDENNNGGPDEYQPDVLQDFGYQTLEAVQPFMYDDTSDTSLVFYTFQMFQQRIVLILELS